STDGCRTAGSTTASSANRRRRRSSRPAGRRRIPMQRREDQSFRDASSISHVRTYINAGDKRPIDGGGSGEIRIFHACGVSGWLFSPICRRRAKPVSCHVDGGGRLAEPHQSILF